jgi:hypothetical protein
MELLINFKKRPKPHFMFREATNQAVLWFLKLSSKYIINGYILQ